MFFDKWIPEKLLNSSVVCGIEFFITDEGYICNYILIKNKANQLSIIESGQCNSILNLPVSVKKDKIPVCLIITGKGIITKKLSLNSTDEISNPEFIQQELPAFSSEDFFMQSFPQNNNTCFSSIIRKTKLESIIGEFKEKGLLLCDAMVGPGGIISILPLITGSDKLFSLASIFETENNYLSLITDKASDAVENKNQVGDLSVHSKSILAFSAAFSYLTKTFLYINHSKLDVKERFYENQKAKVVLYSFIGLAFLICLLNFFVFSFYFGKAKELQGELDIFEGKHEKISRLLSEYEKKKELIEKTGMTEGGNIAEYSDKIAKSIPEEVVITEMNFYPEISDETETDSLFKFSKSILIIKGNCNKSLVINEWVNVLKSLDFVKNANLETFLFKSEGNLPNFELKIVTR